MINSAGRYPCLVTGALFFFLVHFLVHAAGAEALSPEFPVADEEPMDVSADRVEYDPSGPYMIGQGNVTVRQGDREIAADYVQINTETEDAYARGRVELRREGVRVWRGEELLYNLRTGVGDFGTFSLFVPPYQVRGERSRSEGMNRLFLEEVMVSPCPDESSREFRMTATRARLSDQRYLRLRHIIAWLGPVPVLYFPVWHRDLKAPGRWTVEPGYRSRLGAYLLTRYRVPLDDRKTIRSRSHVNLYSDRGVGFGQDLEWNDPDRGVESEFLSFAIPDQRLYRTDEEEAERETYLDDSFRYRFRLVHDQFWTDRDRFFLDTTVLSDPYVQEDFLRSEYRSAPEPENRIAVTHRSDFFTASLLANARLNDFYRYHERLPEVLLVVPRLRIANTPVFYQGEHSGVSLTSRYPFDAEQEDFSTVRLDTHHLLLYPRRYLGFLSVTPRVGLRMTHYSKTYGKPETVTRTELQVNEETGLEEEVEIEETVRTPGGADLRTLGELGAEVSFKACKVITENPHYWGDGFRHVVEPYANYTWRPKPDLRPIELYPFDEIDEVDLDHSLRLGVRNKLQTRRRRNSGLDPSEEGDLRAGAGGTRIARDIWDLIDTDLSTRFRLERLSGENFLAPFEGTVRLRPSDRVYLEVEAAYDSVESRLDWLNARTLLFASDRSSLDLEYRYRLDRRNLVTANWLLRPKHTWSLQAYQRYDLDESQLTEHGYGLIRRHRCVGWGVGVRHEPGFDPGEDDEFRFWAQLWLLADPDSGFRVGG